jgi:amino acid adenylation domain-containing protein
MAAKSPSAAERRVALAQRLASLSPDRRALLEREPTETSTHLRVAPSRRDRASALAPLSFSQERLWLQYQLDPTSPAYHCPFLVRLRGPLVFDALEAALNEVVRRHEILRSVFVETAGQPSQRVEPPSWHPLPIVDLAWLDEDENIVVSLVAETLATPFDLASEPPFRAALFRRSDELHSLYLTFHHMVVDGPSMENFASEVSKLYRSFVAGDASALRDPELQYADYAVWQRERARAEDALRALRDETQNVVPPAALRLGDRLARSPTHRAASLPVEVPAWIVEGLRVAGARENASPFMVLLAALWALLHRMTGTDDVSVGVPFANRNSAEVESLIGFFVRTVGLRSRIEENPTFFEMVAASRAAVLKALEDHVEVSADSSHSVEVPLTVMFIYQKPPSEWKILPELGMMHVPLPSLTAKCDLVLSVVESAEGVPSVFWEYDCDRFSTAQIAQIAACFSGILRAAAEDPGKRLFDWPLLGTSGVEGRTDVMVEPSSTLALGFERRAEERPDAVALISTPDDEAAPGAPTLHLTYAVMNAMANRLARGLPRQGPGPETVVGVYAERSPEAIMGMLAVLKAGQAFVALDPALPADRLSYMVDDARVRHILLGRGAQWPGAETSVTLLRIDAFDAESDSSNPPRFEYPDQAAYVVYTSGSTGRPKGVVATHRGALNRFAWMWREYRFDRGEVCCQRTPLSFVDSIWEILGPLLGGATGLILSDRCLTRPELMVAALQENQVTRITVVPALLQVMLGDRTGREWPSSLKLCISSGEVLSPDMARGFREMSAGQTALLNLYGSSEVSADVTCFVVPSGDALDPVSIGSPIDGMRVTCLDGHLRPMPFGARGRLFVSGPGLARGYLGRPGLTAEKFLPSEARAGSTRAYRTGDLAIIGRDGNVHFVGREDRQLKINGCRVEPGEIENVLLQSNDVERVAVVPRVTANGATILVACVVPTEKRPMAVSLAPAPFDWAQRVARRLRDVLPAHMIPAEFVWARALPLTSSGKVDGGRLQEELARASQAAPTSSPATPIERRVMAMLADVVRVDALDPGSRILSVAANSLLLVRLHLALNRAFPGKVSVQDLFDNPSVRELAALLESGAPESDGEATVEILEI